MIEQELTDKKSKNNKAVAEWIERMQEVPQDDNGWTTKQFAEFLGIPPDLFLKGTAGLLSPVGRRLENRGWSKVFSTEEGRKLGKLVAAGFKFRSIRKNAS
jgi:transposase